MESDGMSKKSTIVAVVIGFVFLLLIGVLGYVSGKRLRGPVARETAVVRESEMRDTNLASADGETLCVIGEGEAVPCSELSAEAVLAVPEIVEEVAAPSTGDDSTATQVLTQLATVPELIVDAVGTADADSEDDAVVEPAKPRAINAPYTIYKNTLSRGWEDRSMNANVNYSGFPAYDGLTAMTVHLAAADATAYVYAPEPISTEGYNVLRFFVNGGTAGNQQITIALVDGNEVVLESVPLTPPYPNNWRQIDIMLEDLGNPETIRGVQWRDSLGKAQPVFFIDEVALVDDPLAAQFGDNEINGPLLEVDLNAPRYPINPDIYGMNFADESTAAELDMTLNRWGGNAVTRYNYLQDATNTGNNWFFENIPPEDPSPNLPHGSSADKFVQQNNRTDTETLITVPLIGYVARADYSCGFSVEKYGDQIETDEWREDCGAGVTVEGEVLRHDNPQDTSIAIRPSFVTDWVRHLVSQFGSADGEEGVRYYNLDNEPMIWSHTHRDVHPDPLTTDDFWARSIAIANAVKDGDPTAQLLGPVFWGWTSYWWSDVDVNDDVDPKVTAPDREAHDNLPLAAWYLREFARYDEAHGRRLLDYFDLHFYPQSVGVAFNVVGDESIQALRLRTTRALWDEGYVDESWINEPVNLIPRMHDWVDTYYPGTKLAISEYNWGGLEHINGALAQADVLGIFGREKIDLAALWGVPEKNDPGMFAFRMYRNYNGIGAKFGNMSVSAESENSDILSIFAASRTEDGVLTVIVINKSTVPMTSELLINGLTGDDTLNIYRYSKANLNAIERVPASKVEDGKVIETFAPHSITLLTFGESK
jgi:hypothetical protein